MSWNNDSENGAEALQRGCWDTHALRLRATPAAMAGKTPMGGPPTRGVVRVEERLMQATAERCATAATRAETPGSPKP